MQTETSNLPACHLFSNFLTHSYFSVIENWVNDAQAKPSSSTPCSYALSKALRSFIFVFTASRQSSSLLQHQILDYYEPYIYLSHSQIYRLINERYPDASACFHLNRSLFSYKQAKKVYIQALSKLSRPIDPERLKSCNCAFIKLYDLLLYHEFPNPKDLPYLLTLSNTRAFSLALYERYIEDIAITKGSDAALQYINQIHIYDANYVSSLKNHLEQIIC